MVESWIQALVEFVRANPQWAIVVVFLIGFGECFAFVSLLVPATVFFVAFGAFAGAAKLNLLPLALAAGVGAATGFWASYEIGRWIGPAARHRWPFRAHPEAMDRGHAFFEKWGAPGIFLGHWFGPVRAVIALVAGMVQMPPLPFHIANWAASLLWGFLLLYGTGMMGDYGATILGIGSGR